MFAYLGSFIALLLFMPMVNRFGSGSSDISDQRFAWTLAVVVIAVMCAILFLGCFAWTRERVKPINDRKTSLKEDVRDLFHNKPWWILFGAGVATLVFNSVRDGATVYYFKYYILEEQHQSVSLFGITFVLSGLYLAVGQMANIIGVIMAAPLSNHIGKRRTFALSMLLAVVLSIIFFWFEKDDLVLYSNALSVSVPVVFSRCCGRCMPIVPIIRNCGPEIVLPD
jgi:GPH family glycoside/pentoside/hexuronide:cation symporter